MYVFSELYLQLLNLIASSCLYIVLYTRLCNRGRSCKSYITGAKNTRHRCIAKLLYGQKWIGSG